MGGLNKGVEGVGKRMGAIPKHSGATRNNALEEGGK